MRVLVAVMVALAGCGSSTGSGFGSACTSNAQCDSSDLCVAAAFGSIAETCQPKCSGPSATTCPAGFFCAGGGVSYACISQGPNNSSCDANNVCASLNCADAGNGSYGQCRPDAGP